MRKTLLAIVFVSLAAPGFCAETASPRINEVRFDPVVVSIPAGSGSAIQYETNLRVSFEPMDAPLFLRIKVHYKNRTGEGDQEEPPVDLSQWSKSGSISRNRVFRLPGVYTFTIILRNRVGETSLTAPPLTVQ